MRSLASTLSLAAAALPVPLAAAFGNSCRPPDGGGCIYEEDKCDEQIGVECGILIENVAAKCGSWDLCAGVVCREDYKIDGKQACLARARIDPEKEEWWEGGIYGGRWGTQLIGGWWAYVKEVPCTPETVDVYATGVEIPCCGDLVSCAIANPPGWDYPTRYECHVSCP